jgi:hypothetical protein
MTERLRTWLGEKSDTLIESLCRHNVDLSTLREAHVNATRSVQDTATKYTDNLSKNRDKTSVAAAARALTNALLAFAHTQTILDRHLQEVDAALETHIQDLNTFRTETLREITRLRASAQSATWQSPAPPLCVGTYLDDANSD